MEIRQQLGDSVAFRELCARLDQDLLEQSGQAVRDPFLTQQNKISPTLRVFMAYTASGLAVASAAYQLLGGEKVELKRVYVDPNYRKQKVATRLLEELFQAAQQEGATVCLLETGRNFVVDQRFYQKLGFHQIPNYPPYEGNAASYCMAKQLDPIGVSSVEREEED